MNEPHVFVQMKTEDELIEEMVVEFKEMMIEGVNLKLERVLAERLTPILERRAKLAETAAYIKAAELARGPARHGVNNEYTRGREDAAKLVESELSNDTAQVLKDHVERERADAYQTGWNDGIYQKTDAFSRVWSFVSDRVMEWRHETSQPQRPPSLKQVYINQEAAYSDVLSEIKRAGVFPDTPSNKWRINKAFEMIEAANTVTIMSLGEMEALISRALTGEFDGERTHR